MKQFIQNLKIGEVAELADQIVWNNLVHREAMTRRVLGRIVQHNAHVVRRFNQ